LWRNILLGLLFAPENGGSTFLRNVDELPPDYMAQKIVLFIDIIVKISLYWI
jgi:hypothetical protein